MKWRIAARQILQLTDVEGLAQAAKALAASAVSAASAPSTAGHLATTATLPSLDTQARLLAPPDFPGVPARPRLVAPQALPRRSFHTAIGRAALMHAVAHIEMNAIRLALDAVWRFEGLPPAYYADWLRIAGEEAHHFQLVNGWLQARGHRYGEFDAHNGLWEMVERTRHDVVARMALVPRTLEARGLDATPPMQQRLAAVGETEAVAVLEVILRDEVGHVAVGNRWYRWLCDQRGLDPAAHYAHLCQQHRAPRLRGPFNWGARQAAGFTPDELQALEAADAPQPSRSAAASTGPQAGTTAA